jgi:hypothetical protein
MIQILADETTLQRDITGSVDHEIAWKSPKIGCGRMPAPYFRGSFGQLFAFCEVLRMMLSGKRRVFQKMVREVRWREEK